MIACIERGEQPRNPLWMEGWVRVVLQTFVVRGDWGGNWKMRIQLGASSCLHNKPRDRVEVCWVCRCVELKKSEE